MKTSLKNYAFRYLVPIMFVVMGVWAFLFYQLILDEVYDNIDDGLKNQKIEIIREAYINKEILDDDHFGVNQYRIEKVDENHYDERNRLTTKLIFMPYDGEDEPYRVLETGFHGKNGEMYSLEIRTSMVEEDEMLFNLAISLIALYILLMISGLVIHQVVMAKALRPFQSILNQIKAYRTSKNKTIETVDSPIKEFDELEQEFLEMVQRNEAAFHQQKLFIENASHELQTPLAATINQLDLVLEKGNLPEYELVKIAEAKDSLWRLVQLNKSLLMLSRIDNKQYAFQENVLFNQLIKDWINEMKFWLEEQNFTIQLIENGVFETQFNKELGKVLISNLIRNAIKYSVNSKTITITLDNQQIIIENTGEGKPLNPNVIFERFYKSGNASQSYGLGLSIVQSILKQQETVSINYNFVYPNHQFILRK